MRKAYPFLLFILTFFAYSCNKTPVVNYNQELKNIIDSANIPLIQAKYITPTDTIYCQVGESPSEKDSTNAVFQACSLSKVVFAYIVLKMSDLGEIDLDRPLYEYTDIERFTDKEEAKKLTARIVLCHRSGLKGWATSPSSKEWPTSPITFRYPVDSVFNYSGEAYTFLQRAIENIKGKDLQQIAKEYVFDPFDMPLSSYEWIPEYEELATASYNRERENRGVRQFPRQSSAHSLRSCANDYSNFLRRAILNGEGLSAETHREMITAQTSASLTPKNPREVDLKNTIFWGLGIGIEENPHYGKVLWHWGDNGPTKALFILLQESQKSLIYFANSSAGLDIIPNVTSLFLQDDYPFDLTDWIKDEE